MSEWTEGTDDVVDNYSILDWSYDDGDDQRRRSSWHGYGNVTQCLHLFLKDLNDLLPRLLTIWDLGTLSCMGSDSNHICYEFPSLSVYTPSFSPILASWTSTFHLFPNSVFYAVLLTLLITSILLCHASRTSYLWLIHLMHLSYFHWLILLLLTHSYCGPWSIFSLAYVYIRPSSLGSSSSVWP